MVKRFEKKTSLYIYKLQRQDNLRDYKNASFEQNKRKELCKKKSYINLATAYIFKRKERVDESKKRTN